MIISSLIIVVSTVLFCYWFRYTCVLILSTRTTRDFSEDVAAANNLHFAEIPAQLAASSREELDQVQQSLERDYAVVTHLLAKAGNVEIGEDSLEDIMLRLDFRAMSLVYSVSRYFSSSGARGALDEMTQIVAHLANVCGERAVDSAQA